GANLCVHRVGRDEESTSGCDRNVRLSGPALAQQARDVASSIGWALRDDRTQPRKCGDQHRQANREPPSRARWKSIRVARSERRERGVWRAQGSIRRSVHGRSEEPSAHRSRRRRRARRNRWRATLSLEPTPKESAMSAPNPRVREEMRQILIAVSEVWGVSVEEIIERDRHKTV